MMEPAFAFVFLGFMCVFLIVLLAIVILYFMALQRALSLCAPRNRSMEPAMVWLNLVPIFNFYWGFHTAIHIGDSLKREFIDRDLDDGSDYGKTIGIWYSAASVVNFVLSVIGAIPRLQFVSYLTWPIAVAGFVLFVLYWVRIHGYNKQLAEDNLRGDDRYDDDDRDDDRPRRPLRGPTSTDIRSAEKDDRYS